MPRGSQQTTQLVCQHLERVSRTALEKYQSLIQSYVRRRRGIYALYRGDRLYYVGLASNLGRRLKHHLRDRHAHTWDRFSAYLTLSQAKYLRELESLVVRIATPRGNRQTGRFACSEDLRGQFRHDIARYHKQVEGALLGEEDDLPAPREAVVSAAGRRPVLTRYITKRMRLRLTRRGNVRWAWVLKDGHIKVDGKSFTSPTLAAIHALGRPGTVNGWRAWSYERAPGDWVSLDELRR